VNLLHRAAVAAGLATRADSTGGSTPSPGVLPPARSDASPVTTDTVLSLHAMFRALMIHVIAASQLSIDVERAGRTVETPPLAGQPDPEQSRSAWIEANVASLSLTGNAFWRLYRDATGQVVAARVLDPHRVTVVKNLDRRTAPDGEAYSYYLNAERIRATEVRHLAFLRVPGHVSGLGPIQAARGELAGVMSTRDYASRWFTDSGQAAAVLKFEQKLTPEQAERYREQWHAAPAGRVRVLGGGGEYVPFALNPADAQWLESQQFDVTRIARLMGVPASLMLATVQGGSMTYANVEQDWIGYVRFSLMKYLREIEEALTGILPAGQSARFNIETLLRSDTKTRYEGYEIGIRAGWLLPSEARATEHLTPVEGIDDRPLLLPTPTSTTPQEARA